LWITVRSDWAGRKTAKLAREAPAEALTPGLAKAVGNQIKDVGEGERLLRIAQALRPGDFWVNVFLADAVANNGKWVEAETYDPIALALRPNLSAAYNGLGVDVERLAKLTEAETLYRKAIEVDPKNALPPSEPAQLKRSASVDERLGFIFRCIRGPDNLQDHVIFSFGEIE